MRVILIPALLLLSACGAAVDAPSLAQRPAETIDPRLPVGSPEPAPGSLTIGNTLFDIVSDAEVGIAAYDAAYFDTRQLVSDAGAPGSESWVSAQEALSKLEEARAPLPVAIGDLDSLISDAIRTDGWSSPANRDAAEKLMRRLRLVDEEQTRAIERMTLSLAN